MGLLSGKKALICGVANERSIAWAIAQTFAKEGASLGFTYVNDAIEKRLAPLAQELKADFLHPLDVTVDSHFPSLRDKVKERWGEFDILVHSLAFADKDDLKKQFVETSRQGFLLAMDVSAYSLVALCQSLRECMTPHSSVMAMTYHGSQKVIDNYNVMGVAKAALEASVRYLAHELGEKKIKVNAISAGPIKTLASSGIAGFRSILTKVEEQAPLRQNVTTEDVAGAAVYLGSDYARAVTGQILYVDSGMSILGI